MKYWRSFDGIVLLGWMCTIVFVLTIQDLSDDASIVSYDYGVMAAAVAFVALTIYLGTRMRRQAEKKVRTSELILLTDIQVLAKSNSKLLDDAITLRCAQIGQGSSPGR